MSRGAVTAVVVALLAAGCGGGGDADGGPEGTSGPVTSSVDTAAPSSVSGSDGGALPASVDEVLERSPEIVEPVVAPGVWSSGAVSAASGGTVRLDVPASESVGAWSATLVVPAGAVESDVTVTLMAVESVGGADAASGWRGVEIQPSGLVFPADAVPRLTFTGVPEEFVGSAVGWDGEGVVEPAAVAVEPDGSVTVGVRHFSGYGGGDPNGPGAGFGAAFDELRATIGVLLNELADAMLRGDATDLEAATDAKIVALLDQFGAAHLDPLMTAASVGCRPGARDAVSAFLAVDTQRQLLGADSLGSDPVEKVLRQQMECARQACDESQDPAAGGLFMWALRGALNTFLGGAEGAALAEEGLDLLRRCGAWRITASGHGDDMAGLAGVVLLDESFLATGLVPASGEGVVPMRVTSNIIEASSSDMYIVGSVLANQPGVEPTGPVCTGSDFGPSAMRITVGEPDEAPDGTLGRPPVVRMTPFVTPAEVTCGQLSSPTETPFMFLVLAAPEFGVDGIEMDGGSFVHRFTEAERVGTSWSYTGSLEWNGGGLDITLSLMPASVVDRAPAPPSTAGMVDAGALAAAGGGG